jgi:hypothetical protein
VLTKYRLLLEMKSDMMWFWNSNEDDHGTTVSEYALDNGSINISNNDIITTTMGQWTSVSVIPRAVGLSFARN